MQGRNSENEFHEAGGFLKNGAVGPVLLLAHGAGAPMDSDFLHRLARVLESSGIRVWRFEFNYMAGRRCNQSKRPPPRVPVLLEEWRRIISLVDEPAVFIGGKSLGGRVASMLCAEDPPAVVKGCLCFGYPFHPPANPDRWRTDHFPALTVPTWLAQGERDIFGQRQRVEAQLETLALPENRLQVEWVPEGDHDLKPPQRSAFTWEDNLERTGAAAAAFIRGLGWNS